MKPGDIRPVQGRCLWTAAQIEDDQSWIWTFSPGALQEIDGALRAAEKRGVQASPQTREDFPLPGLAAEFARLAQEVDEGLGLQVLRGFPVERYSVEQLRILYRGIGLYFGTPLVQTPAGDQMIDVRNEGAVSNLTTPDGQRVIRRGGYSSDAALAFHTDGANMVGLLSVRSAKEGGLSLVSSAAAVHNAMLARNPELAAVMYQLFPVDRRAGQPAGEPPIYPWKIPVFSITNERFNCVYDRNATQWGCERTGRPFSPLETEAFDTFDSLARDPEFALATELKPGDIQFVNNFTVLHSRTAFVDWPDLAQGRLLLRLWLDVPGSRHAGLNKLHLYTRAAVPQGIVLERTAPVAAGVS